MALSFLRKFVRSKQNHLWSDPSSRFYEALFHYTQDSAFVLDLDGNITRVNGSFERCMGRPAEHMLYRSLFLFVHPDHLDRTRLGFVAAARGEVQQYSSVLTYNGRTKEVDVLFVPFFSGNAVSAIYGFARPRDKENTVVTPQSGHENEVVWEDGRNYDTRHPAIYHAHSTERAAFVTRLAEVVEQAALYRRCIGLYFVKLDGFLELIDSLGSATEVEIIRFIEHRLATCLGEHDQMSSFSFGEYTVMIADLNEEGRAETFGLKLLDALSEPINLDGTDYHVSGRVGLCTYPYGANDAMMLMRNARIALHHAAKHGRRFQAYDHELLDASTRSFTLQNDLHRAIAKHEFVVHYQPRVDIRTGVVVGAEALIRWQHPTLGLVYPDEFIPYAEETGAIIPIGEWVLRAVCEQYAEWRQAGLPAIQVSVNLSAVQLTQQDIVDIISNLLSESDLEPHVLEIEITETAFIDNEELFRAKLDALHALGIVVALDDFGTGYSTFHTLKRFAIDVLKIDKTFVHDVLQDADSSEIVSTLIGLGHSLGMKVVAEGVETKEQYRILAEMQCDELQGYLFNRPVTAEKFVGCLMDVRAYADAKEESDQFNNRRRFFRIELPSLLHGSFTIKEIKRQEIQTGSTRVSIGNIGPGGLRFYSDLRLDTSPHLLVKIDMEVLGEQIEVYGHVVWKRELPPKSCYEYGLEFNMNDHRRDQLTGLLNKLSVSLRESPATSSRLRAVGKAKPAQDRVH